MRKRYLADILRLIKGRLALAVGAATFAGYALHPAAPLVGALPLLAGIIILAAGAGCLNNWQDRHFDRLLDRTRDRPLPAGRVGAPLALALACGLIAVALAILCIAPFPWRAPITAAVSVLCYNALYTPLKRWSVLAMAPGIACGSLPPLIGWFAAGGGLDSAAVWGLIVVFGLWQPPHFWLIVLRHHGDYPRGGFPSLLSILTRPQIIRILFSWAVALAMALLSLPLAVRTMSPLLVSALLADSALMIALFAGQLFFRRSPPNYRLLFVWLNLTVFVGVFLAVLCTRHPA